MNERRSWLVIDSAGVEQHLAFRELVEWVADGRLNFDDRVCQPDQKYFEPVDAVIGLVQAVKLLRQSTESDTASYVQDVRLQASTKAISALPVDRSGRRPTIISLGAVAVVAVALVGCFGIIWYQFIRWQRFPLREGVSWTTLRFWWPVLNEVSIVEFVLLVLDTLILSLILARWLQNRKVRRCGNGAD